MPRQASGVMNGDLYGTTATNPMTWKFAGLTNGARGYYTFESLCIIQATCQGGSPSMASYEMSTDTKEIRLIHRRERRRKSPI